MPASYRIVCTDNFNRQGEVAGRDEYFITGEMSKEDAEALAALKNSKSHPTSPDFYKAVPNNYKLQLFKP